jgi:hypothetical protein
LKSALDALNAHYERHDIFDFEFENMSFALEGLNFAADIDTIANEFESVHNFDPITPEFEFDVDDHPMLVHFVSFYRQLSVILFKTPVQNPLLPTSPSETTPPN